MNAAVKAFARNGLKGTSMQDIVKESGLSKGAIYWYFKSKDELIMELMNTFFSTGMDEFKEILDSPAPASVQIGGFLDLVVSEMKKMMHIRPVIQELYVLALRDRTVKKITKKEFETYHTMLESIIRKGIRQGEFRNVEPHQMANSILSLIEGTIVIWSIGVRDIDVEQQVINGVNFLISSIKT